MAMKTRRITSTWAFACAVFGFGCGGESTSSMTSQGELLCDGSDEPRLLIQYGYEPERFAGFDLHFENGYGFLVVDGSCRFWGTQRPWSPVRAGTLEPRQIDNLVGILRLGDWEHFVGSYCSVPTDSMGPKWMKARLGDAEIVIDRECEETEDDKVKFVDWILRTTPLSIAQLEANHAPTDGPMRFVLVRDPMTNMLDLFDHATSWPLATSAHDVSVDWGNVDWFRETQKSLVAEGEEAQALRELANRYRRGEFGSPDGFIPIEQYGWYYRLYVRDTIPIEDDDGLWSALALSESTTTTLAGGSGNERKYLFQMTP